ncbi:hypothetical protein PQO03_17920 [Lentisphaera profundi]|jgi:hypothetical protein|uniref:Uncharacterized protein n=1 Tax=Lentisphaera profundi TaxID=1658616 RepID=A0ABY7VY40_9BACT|nr:hypothetical protein [Lentisphaera profundi]WDE97706.1 hypothetical protein PQO03_17920 [Lentisphaera profundi]
MKEWREMLCVLLWAPHIRAAEQTTIKETGSSTLSIGNDLVRLDYDCVTTIKFHPRALPISRNVSESGFEKRAVNESFN